MTSPNDTAFPTNSDKDTNGQTKREWYAGLALQGLLAGSGRSVSWDDEDTEERAYARQAVADADALIAELAKEKS